MNRKKEAHIAAIFAMTGYERMMLIDFVQKLALPEHERTMLKTGRLDELSDLLAKYYDLYLKQVPKEPSTVH